MMLNLEKTNKIIFLSFLFLTFLIGCSTNRLEKIESDLLSLNSKLNSLENKLFVIDSGLTENQKSMKDEIRRLYESSELAINDIKEDVNQIRGKTDQFEIEVHNKRQLFVPVEKHGSKNGFKFKVYNNCKHKVKLAIHFQKPNKKWETVGWWTLKAYSENYLKYRNGGYPRTKTITYFYYAETDNKAFKWKNKNNKIAFQGRELPMIKEKDTNGDTEIKLYCNS